MFSEKLFLAVILVWNLHEMEGCKCIAPDTYKQFCAADFVTLARIQRVTENPTEFQRVYDLLRIYHFRKRNVFQNSLFNKGATFSVQTAIHSATCGANLGEIGEYILISGHVDADGKLMTSSCDWNSKFLGLPKKTINELFDGFYRDTCNQVIE